MKANQEAVGFFGEYGDSLTFETSDDCFPEQPKITWTLEGVDTREPKNQMERFILGLYLRWVFEKIPFKIDTPLRITRADGNGQPDFAICENGQKYGLEITRGTTYRDERVLDELVKAGPGYHVELDASLDGEDQQNFDPKAEISPVGGPYYGEPMMRWDNEIKWAKFMVFRISDKLGKLNSNYVNFLPSCDLVVYSTISIDEIRAALRFLKEQYAASVQFDSLTHHHFQRIIIVCEKWSIFDPLGNNPQVFRSESLEDL